MAVVPPAGVELAGPKPAIGPQEFRAIDGSTSYRMVFVLLDCDRKAAADLMRIAH